MLCAAALCASSVLTGRAMAATRFAATAGIPRVFAPVAPEFSRSPIPVYVPSWFPGVPKRVYAGKIYPGFETFKGGYNLGLYTSPRYFDHAHELFAVAGSAEGFVVDTHTRPVWLGKKGWAYLHWGGNSGTTISIVRPGPSGFVWDVDTYTLIFACPFSLHSPTRYVGCLKRVAASMHRVSTGE